MACAQADKKQKKGEKSAAGEKRKVACKSVAHRMHASRSMRLSSFAAKAKSSTGEVFKVESIQDHRGSGKGLEFFVKWEGYPVSENSWLCSSSMKGDMTRCGGAWDDACQPLSGTY